MLFISPLIKFLPASLAAEGSHSGKQLSKGRWFYDSDSCNSHEGAWGGKLSPHCVFQSPISPLQGFLPRPGCICLDRSFLHTTLLPNVTPSDPLRELVIPVPTALGPVDLETPLPKGKSKRTQHVSP